jgi:hypothetical protein
VAEFSKFEEYRLFVDDTARFSERRQTVSNIYVAVNSLLLAAIGILIKDLGARSPWTLLLPIPLIAAGILICLWWRQLIFKYKRLVGLRIDTLREMENGPGMESAAKMYHVEDTLYPRNQDGSMVRGRGLSIADLEARLPLVFIGLYAIFGLGTISAMLIRVFVTATRVRFFWG